MDTGQEKIFNLCALSLVECFIEGYNATVMAYGQTGSGKTYTMGSHFGCEASKTEGIIPRLIRSVCL